MQKLDAFFFKTTPKYLKKAAQLFVDNYVSECARPGYTKIAQNILQTKIVLLIIYHTIL